ncbi:MAG: NAD(+) synthase [Pseudomonadota bacterium]|nr:NAD(+) synthase [Pseudomonadota bacterium]
MNNREKIDFITNWIMDYASNMQNPAKTLVVGVSGGIDSALTSSLCALTGIHTIAVRMPIINSCEIGSIKHCDWLKKSFNNVEVHEIDLTNIFEKFSNITKKIKFESELGYANSKSRFRMITLYQIASSTNGLVVGTGNKVEDFGVGFFTKYGDGGVDISPIADLTKSQVKELATELNISDEILDAEPTDGLWDDGRTDEEQLGLTYQQIEDAMINKDSKYKKMYEDIRKKSLHKMKPIPVCIINDKDK